MSQFIEWSDIDVRFTKSRAGNIRIVEGEEAINQSIKLILSIMRGDKVRSELGSSLYGLLFEPISDDTAEEMENVIGTNIERYENRVNLERVRVIPNIDQKYYEVVISYRLYPTFTKKSMTTYIPAMGDM